MAKDLVKAGFKAQEKRRKVLNKQLAKFQAKLDKAKAANKTVNIRTYDYKVRQAQGELDEMNDDTWINTRFVK